MLTIECNKCKKRVSASAVEIIEGMICQECGAPLRLDDGSASSIYDSGSTLHYEQCPKCRTEMTVEANDNRPLVVCDNCSRMFLHSKLQKLSARRSPWSSEQLVDAIESSNKDKSLSATIRSYDSREVRAVKLLGISGTEHSPEIVLPLLQSIFFKADKELERLYPNYAILPPDRKLKMALAMSRSHALRRFFFGENIGIEDVDFEMRTALLDDALYEALKREMEKSDFGIVSAYMKEFVEVVYGIMLDGQALSYLVLKVISRGLAEEIRGKGYFIYYSESGQVRSTTDLNIKGRRAFYLNDDPLNGKLKDLCASCGIGGVEKKGCMSVIIFLGLAAFMILRSAN